MTSRSWQYISCHWDACSNHLAISDLLKEMYCHIVLDRQKFIESNRTQPAHRQPWVVPKNLRLDSRLYYNNYICVLEIQVDQEETPSWRLRCEIDVRNETIGSPQCRLNMSLGWNGWNKKAAGCLRDNKTANSVYESCNWYNWNYCIISDYRYPVDNYPLRFPCRQNNPCTYKIIYAPYILYDITKLVITRRRPISHMTVQAENV